MMARGFSLCVLFISLLITACGLTVGIDRDHIPSVTAMDTKPIETGLKVYSDDLLQLAYPKSWLTLDEVFNRPSSRIQNKEFGARIILTITNNSPNSYGDKYTAWCDVMDKSLTEGYSRDESMASAYMILKNYPQYKVSETMMTVNGKDAVEKIYRRPRGEPWYQVRDVWIFGSGKSIILSCYSHPDDYEENLRIFQDILNSIEIKE